ncbi:unnamed protein product [Discosporangium mesarthrocarpum]
MFVEAEYFALPSRNAKFGTCVYVDEDNLRWFLVVNSEGLFFLRTGVGIQGDRYTLEPVKTTGVPAGAELVSCGIIPACRRRGLDKARDVQDDSKSLSCGALVCLLMALRVEGGMLEPTSHGRDDGHSRSATPLRAAGRSTPSGLLNVYSCGLGSGGGSVEEAFVGEEYQQLQLDYAPLGVAHATVWRFQGVGESQWTPDEEQTRKEGDALLVCGGDGRVHVYTCWPSSENVPGGRRSQLKEENDTGIAAMVPELRVLQEPVLSLAVRQGHCPRTGRWCRQVMAGCADGYVRLTAYYRDDDSMNTLSFSVDGPVAGVTIAVDSEAKQGAEISEGAVGFVSGCLGTASACQLGEDSLLWTGTIPLLEGDAVLCVSYAEFGRDNCLDLVLGTYFGTVGVYRNPEEGVGWQLVEAGLGDSSQFLAGQLYNNQGGVYEWKDPVPKECWERIGAGSGGEGDDQAAPERRKGAGVRHGPRNMAAMWERQMPFPVYSITIGDFNHDGVEEMVVTTMYSVHVMQPNYEHEVSRLRGTLDILQSLQGQGEGGRTAQGGE